jgi:hypothetical protein
MVSPYCKDEYALIVSIGGSERDESYRPGLVIGSIEDFATERASSGRRESQQGKYQLSEK